MGSQGLSQRCFRGWRKIRVERGSKSEEDLGLGIKLEVKSHWHRNKKDQQNQLSRRSTSSPKLKQTKQKQHQGKKRNSATKAFPTHSFQLKWNRARKALHLAIKRAPRKSGLRHHKMFPRDI